MAIVPKAKREVTIGFVRDGRPARSRVVPDGQGKYELGDIGIQPPIHPKSSTSVQAQPAAQAGLQNGDVILAADGERQRLARPS